ncbi:MAG TPA: TatD family hydrolase [Sphingobacteriaceae bacterium]|nr:TatD family hydrolase [Sphingobacteriaceae bacterium]
MEREEFSLIDTHTHAYYIEDPADQSALLERCATNHVHKLLLPNVDRESIAAVQAMQAHFPDQCFAMMGLHPCNVKADYQEQLTEIEQALNSGKVWGVGEIGLDLYWDQSTIAMQVEAFKIQTEWAKELDLPVSIHCRAAYDELFELLEEIQDGRLRGVLHCFTGTEEQAWRTIDFGLFLGIGGVVTFKNAGLDRVVEKIPLEHLVLETDSPYLAPVPFRGKQNESSYLLHIAKKVADLHTKTVNEVAKITTGNAVKIFRLNEGSK